MQSVTPFLRLYEIQDERKFFITFKNSDQPIIIAITPLMNPTVVTTKSIIFMAKFFLILRLFSSETKPNHFRRSIGNV